MTSLPPPTTAPAGWYPDPSGDGQRYFDGRAWVDPVGATGREPHPRLPLQVAVGALLVLTASLIGGKVLVEFLVRYDWPVIVYAVILATIGYGPSLVWSAHVRRRWGDGGWSPLGWSFRWSDFGWGPLTWMAAIGAQIVCAVIVLVFDIPLSSNVDSAAELDADRAYLVATLVAAVIAAPIVEELVFRGVVLRGLLSRLHPVVAIAAQAVLFGAAHVDPVRGRGNIGLVIVLSGVGVAFGVAAYLARRLGPTVIAHAIFNGVVMAIVLSGVLDDVETDLGTAVLVVAALVQ